MLGSALSGIARADASAGTAAADISRLTSPQPGDPEIASDFVTLSTSASGVAIGAKLAHVAQEDDKALLSIVA